MGTWDAGPHTVGVTFINGAYGDTSGTDRNLFVEQVACSAAVASGARATLLSNGTATFTVMGDVTG